MGTILFQRQCAEVATDFYHLHNQATDMKDNVNIPIIHLFVHSVAF